ncbi:hypothetical protein G7047_30620 (plasmid) [Diaphorobacter sp. HDW4A]|uniref:hypothetical protein n=1 Tax=Diaphorobacter sp. HDW4A TaxID=2714924 RepID=UPI00140C9360|nr:hypothetical protein [Diaphorobacter sp. HDW4A]QIL84367.1 hypothetical protein G7047_30620 [Diaphorobacter sp. HDW4A]
MPSYLSRWDVLFAWLTASMLLFSATWGSIPEIGANPIPGLQSFSSNLWFAWPASMYALLLAAVVSKDRDYTAIQLRIFAAFSALVWLVLALLVSPGASIGFGVISGWLFREAKKRG